MRHARFMMVVGLVAGGCLDADDAKLDYFRRPEPPTSMAALAPASTETAARVDVVGRKLLAANPQIGARPQFHTIGAPHAELFHRGTSDIFITEGLVRQTPDDSQLAALLASELGKMVRNREAQVPAALRTRTPLPPIDSRFGNDDMMGGTTDRSNTRVWEEYDRDRKARRQAPLPDANVLAQNYLRAAGLDPMALVAAEPLLRQAAARNTLEKQLSPSVPAPTPIPIAPGPGVVPLPSPPPSGGEPVAPPPGVRPIN